MSVLGARPRENPACACVWVGVRARAHKCSCCYDTHPARLVPGHMFLWAVSFFRSLLPPVSFKSNQRERRNDTFAKQEPSPTVSVRSQCLCV